MMRRWNQRPTEEANLFNPAFLAALIYEFIKAYEPEEDSGASLFLVLLALTMSLHGNSRDRLPTTTGSNLYNWVMDNQDLQIGFAERAQNLWPYVREALSFGVAQQRLTLGNGHNLALGKQKATFTKSFLDETTYEVRGIVESCRLLGRWFMKSGSESAIAAALGVKP